MVLMVLGLCGSTALALAPMGPPKATLKQGQFKAGSDYSCSKMDIGLNIYDTFKSVVDVKTNIIAANLGYGITDYWEGSIRLGAENAKVEGFDGDAQFCRGFGIKTTFIQDGSLTWGALFQINWLRYNLSAIHEFNLYEVQFAPGASIEIGGISLYGGPFLHFVGGYECGSFDSLFDVKEKLQEGGYCGAQVNISKKSSWNVEYQLTSDASAISTGFVWRF